MTTGCGELDAGTPLNIYARTPRVCQSRRAIWMPTGAFCCSGRVVGVLAYGGLDPGRGGDAMLRVEGQARPVMPLEGTSRGAECGRLSLELCGGRDGLCVLSVAVSYSWLASFS